MEIISDKYDENGVETGFLTLFEGIIKQGFFYLTGDTGCCCFLSFLRLFVKSGIKYAIIHLYHSNTLPRKKVTG